MLRHEMITRGLFIEQLIGSTNKADPFHSYSSPEFACRLVHTPRIPYKAR